MKNLIFIMVPVLFVGLYFFISYTMCFASLGLGMMICPHPLVAGGRVIELCKMSPESEHASQAPS